MMMLMGPHTALGNIPRSIEYSVDWVTGLIAFATKRGLTRLEATPEGAQQAIVALLGAAVLLHGRHEQADEQGPLAGGWGGA